MTEPTGKPKSPSFPLGSFAFYRPIDKRAAARLPDCISPNGKDRFDRNQNGAQFFSWNRISPSIFSLTLPREWNPAIDNQHVVPMGSYGILQAAKGQFLQTDGLAICVALVLYDEKTRTGLVSHMFLSNINPLDPLATVEKMLRDLRERGIQTEGLQAYVIGGRTKYSDPSIWGLTQALSCHGISVQGFDILGKDLIRDVALDLRTGKVYIRTKNDPDPYPF